MILQNTHYLEKILSISNKYLKTVFKEEEYNLFLQKIDYILKIEDRQEIIKKFSKEYIGFVKNIYQEKHTFNEKLNSFLEQEIKPLKIIWGDCLEVLKGLKSESVHCMVTSPPYYNARDYSIWENLNIYLEDMENIIKECYRVLDNHRVFVFNVGDIFDNDNLTTKSVWGKRRLPLGAYFINIFEKVGFTFVDDLIWDKGEVQSERHKNGNRPYPFYQYPMNSYEHILVFHKHRLDNTRYPCPICGTLKVNGNTQSEIGLKSWECKNEQCFERSKSNRGKRFSLKTIKTQGEQKPENEIENNFIKQWRKDIIKFPPVIKINSKGNNTLGHTAPFPEQIPEFAIKMFSYKNEKILDPFAGSFTSCIVANKLKRIGIGIEINKERFRESIQKNIKNKLGKLDDVAEFDYKKIKEI